MVSHRPGVGENLQDHLEFYFQVACTQPITLYSSQAPIGKAAVLARWLLRRDGLGATNHFETGGFIRSRPGVRHPDIQYHFLPLAITYDGKGLVPDTGSRLMWDRCGPRAAALCGSNVSADNGPFLRGCCVAER